MELEPRFDATTVGVGFRHSNSKAGRLVIKEETFTLEGVSVEQFGRWLERTVGQVGRSFKGKKYKDGEFDTVETYPAPLSDVEKHAGGQAVEIHTTYWHAPTFDSPGVLRGREVAITVVVKPSKTDGFEVAVRLNSTEREADNFYTCLLLAARTQWPDSGLTSQAKLRGKPGRRRDAAHDFAYQEVVIKGRNAHEVYPEWKEKRGTTGSDDVDTYSDMTDAIDYRQKHPKERQGMDAR